jgi:hypothetical protein
MEKLGYIAIQTAAKRLGVAPATVSYKAKRFNFRQRVEGQFVFYNMKDMAEAFGPVMGAYLFSVKQPQGIGITFPCPRHPHKQLSFFKDDPVLELDGTLLAYRGHLHCAEKNCPIQDVTVTVPERVHTALHRGE